MFCIATIIIYKFTENAINTRFKREEIFSNYLDSFKIELQGIVIQKNYIDHNQGYAILIIKNSNTKNHDYKTISRLGYTDFELVHIKNNIAKVFIYDYDRINIGDSISVSFKSRLIKVYEKNKLKSEQIL